MKSQTEIGLAAVADEITALRSNLETLRQSNFERGVEIGELKTERNALRSSLNLILEALEKSSPGALAAIRLACETHPQARAALKGGVK